MPSGGRLEDGTPWMAIGADEPESEHMTVHCECEACGKDHYFDFWALYRGEEITCEHCGHKSRAKVSRYNFETGEMEEI